MTGILDDIAARRLAGQPLTAADAEALATTYDIVTLGMIADEIRRGRHGRTTTFVRVAELRLPLVEEGVSWPEAAGEVRITARFPGIEAATAAVRRVVTAAGDVPVTGFSLVDLEESAGAPDRLTAWLAALREAGLAAIAEAPLDRLAAPVVTLAAAASSGMPIARLVVDAPAPEGPLAVIRRVAALGESVAAVSAFAPLVRRPSEPTTGYTDVKAVALARILLDVPHVQVDWSRHGPKLAQVALTFGADDVDGVSPIDEVAEGRRRAPLEEIRRNIRAASFEPVERNGRFGLL